MNINDEWPFDKASNTIYLVGEPGEFIKFEPESSDRYDKLVSSIKELIVDLEKCVKYEYPRAEMVRKVQKLIEVE